MAAITSPSEIRNEQLVVSRLAMINHQLRDYPEIVREECISALSRLNIFEGDFAIAECLDNEFTQLVFDIKSGEWIFSQSLDLSKTKIKKEENYKWISRGVMIGGALAVGGYVVCLVLKEGVEGLTALKEKPRGDMLSIAAIGALAGAGAGYLYARDMFHYRVKAVELKIEKERAVVNNSIRKIMQTLFNVSAGGARKITCNVTGELLHIPLTSTRLQGPFIKNGVECTRAHHCGPFEYNTIKKDIERNKKCPLCGRIMKMSDLSIDIEKKKEVSRVVSVALSWLLSLKAETDTIDILADENEDFLRNPDEIIRQIRDKTLRGDKLNFVSRLVKDHIKWFNDRIDLSYRIINDDLAKNLDTIGDDQYFNYVRQLISFTRAFKIEIPESIEAPTEVDEKEPVDRGAIIDMSNVVNKDPKNHKAPKRTQKIGGK